MTGFGPDATRLEPVLEAVKPWLSQPNIVGLSTGPKTTGGRPTGDQAVLVYVERKLAAADLGPEDFPVPPSVPLDLVTADGDLRTLQVPTDVVESGENRVEVLNQRVRPVPGGYQIEAENIGGSGTLGVNIVWAGRYRALTNNHVLADNGNLGATVYQPGKANDDVIGAVDGYTPVATYASPNQKNPIYSVQDLAWTYLTQQVGSPDIHLIGRPTGLRAPVAGESIRLIGKQTGVVRAAVIAAIDYKSVTNFSPGSAKPYAYFERMIRLDRKVTTGGDSGCAYVADSDRKVVGLHVGSNDAFSYGCQLWPY